VIITAKRYKFGDYFTLSHVAIDGVEFTGCPYFLEDAVREVEGIPVEQWKIPSETAIPAGRYKVVIDMSQRFGKRMIHLLNVEGFDGVRIHAGNTSHDTEGCLICGKERDEKNGEVSGSRIATDALFKKVDAALLRNEPIWLEIGGNRE
jgi:hypothetical protein